MDISAFNWVDFTIIGIVGLSVLISSVRGFVREAISLATWVLAIWVAYKYGHEFGDRMLTMFSSAQARLWVGIAILFFGVLIAGALVNFIIERFVFFTGLSAFDRILGMAFGFARGVLLVGVLLLVGQVVDMDKNTWWRASQTIPQFSVLTEWLKSFVPEQFERLKHQYEHEHEHEQQKAPEAPKPAVGPESPKPLVVEPQVPTTNTPIVPLPEAPTPTPTAPAPASPTTKPVVPPSGQPSALLNEALPKVAVAVVEQSVDTAVNKLRATKSKPASSEELPPIATMSVP